MPDSRVPLPALFLNVPLTGSASDFGFSLDSLTTHIIDQEGKAFLVLTSACSNVDSVGSKRFVSNGSGDARWTMIQVGPTFGSRSGETHSLRSREVDAFPRDASDLCHVSCAYSSNTLEIVSTFILKVRGDFWNNSSCYQEIQNITIGECCGKIP